MFFQWHLLIGALPELIPKLILGVLSSNLRSYIRKAEHDQAVTKNHNRDFPEPGPNRIRNMGCDQLLYHRKTAKPEILEAREFPLLEIGTEWRGLLRQGGGEARPVSGPEAANLETWGGEPGCGRVSVRGVAGVPEGARWWVFRIPVFQKADIG